MAAIPNVKTYKQNEYKQKRRQNALNNNSVNDTFYAYLKHYLFIRSRH